MILFLLFISMYLKLIKNESLSASNVVESSSHNATVVGDLDAPGTNSDSVFDSDAIDSDANEKFNIDDVHTVFIEIIRRNMNSLWRERMSTAPRRLRSPTLLKSEVKKNREAAVVDCLTSLLVFKE